MVFIIAVTLFFIVLRFAVTVFNFISDPKLRRVSKRYNDLVSVLIPVRNEEENILLLLESISRQDYENYEVIILDDSSSDNTYELCRVYSESHPRFKIIKGGQLPAGWLGKNYACHQLAELATGEFFLFLDADEKIGNQLINSAVHRMYLNKLGLLSLFTNQDMKTSGEKLVVPLMNFILLNLLPLRLVYLTRNSAVAAASGQFMLFNADVYRRNKWHKLVKDKVVEDVEIMRLIKSASQNGETLLANGMISCRMYKSYEEAVNGFSKNFLAAFNYSITGFFIYLLLVIAGPLLVISTLNLNLIVFMCSLILTSRVMISLSSGQHVWYNTLFHPVQMFNLVLIWLTIRSKISDQKYFMERPQGIIDNHLFKKRYFNLSAVSIFTILLFHVAGLIGLSSATYRPLFLTVVPAHLLLMFILIVLNHRYINTRFFIFILIIFLFGFIAEWIGVHTNILFGEYNYGKTLGIKVAGIPLVMCINWFLLVYITGVIAQKTRLKNRWLRIVIGSLILVILDLLIEPIAMRFDYWNWQNNQVPLMNYVCWFIVSFIMLYLFERFEFTKQNWTGPVLLISQFLFFIILNLVNFR